MTKTNPTQLSMKGLMVLSFLLTTVPGFAGDPLPGSAGSSGLISYAGTGGAAGSASSGPVTMTNASATPTTSSPKPPMTTSAGVTTSAGTAGSTGNSTPVAWTNASTTPTTSSPKPPMTTDTGVTTSAGSAGAAGGLVRVDTSTTSTTSSPKPPMTTDSGMTSYAGTGGSTGTTSGLVRVDTTTTPTTSAPKPPMTAATDVTPSTGSPTPVSEPTVSTGTSSESSSFDYLTFACLRDFEATELSEACASSAEACYSYQTPVDELGNSYVIIKLAVPASVCTTENGGMVSYVMGDATAADPQVWCSFVKGSCHE